MPLAALYFDLPEESAEHNAAVTGARHAATLQRISQMIRQSEKYNQATELARLKDLIKDIKNELHESNLEHPWEYL